MAKTPIQIADFSKALAASVPNLVDLSATIAAPNTTVVNRARIPDLANDLGLRFGINRVMTQSIYTLQTEFGPAGEMVSAVVNDILGLIRFVGSWTPRLDTTGESIEGGASGDFVEITFYGTGLNSLEVPQSSGGWTAYTVTVDGGSPFSLTNPAQSTILNGRNTTPNQLRNVTSGLSLGIHTVKIAVGSGAAGFAGFEILNEVSTSLKINPGSYFVGGQRLQLVSQQSSVYNTTFETGALGSKGGHVLVYLKSDGTVGKAVTSTDVTQLNMTSADHTNEEIIRTYYPREMGAGRSDDFSQFSTASNRYFTLDDDTATLVVQNHVFNAPGNQGEGIGLATGAGDFMTFTFIGTGLDVTNVRGATSGTSYTITVDGIAVLTNTIFGGSGLNNQLKIVSGLPYGTHTVKIACTATSGAGFYAGRFIVWGPKIPTLPSGAVSLGDYFVMANFVANTTATIDTMSTGVLRKHTLREMTLSGGTWSIGGINIGNAIGGNNVSQNVSGGVLQYTFYGTGFEMRGQAQNNAGSVSLTLNGLAATTANFPGLVTTAYGGYLFSAGTLTQNANTNGSGVTFSGLPLAVYTLKFTWNNSNNVIMDAIDVITPIHSPKSNIYIDSQNTLPVGSQAINDTRILISSPISGRKAVVKTNAQTSSPTTSSTALVPMPDMSLTIPTFGNPIEILANFTWQNSTVTQNPQFQFFVDGQPVDSSQQDVEAAAGNSTMGSLSTVVPVAAGVHKVDLYWSTTGGTLTAQGTKRVMTAKELYQS